MAKVKIKTKKAAAKRFKITGTGRIKRYHACASHLLSKKTSKRKRRLKKSSIVTGGEKKSLYRIIG